MYNVNPEEKKMEGKVSLKNLICTKVVTLDNLLHRERPVPIQISRKNASRTKHKLQNSVLDEELAFN